MASSASEIHVAVDLIVLTLRDGALNVLLIQREDAPHRGAWALPGGYLNQGEEPAAAAVRELFEETGLTAPASLVPVRAYATVGRDPRARVVSFAYAAVLPRPVEPVAGDDAADARWVPVDYLAADPEALAFDHAVVVADALTHLGVTQ